MDSVWVSDDLIDECNSTLTEFVNEDGFVEVSTILPTALNAKDVEMILRQIPKLSFEYHSGISSLYTVLGGFIVQTSILNAISQRYLHSLESKVNNLLLHNKSVDSCIPSIDQVKSDLLQSCVLMD